MQGYVAQPGEVVDLQGMGQGAGAAPHAGGQEVVEAVVHTVIYVDLGDIDVRCVDPDVSQPRGAVYARAGVADMHIEMNVLCLCGRACSHQCDERQEEYLLLHHVSVLGFTCWQRKGIALHFASIFYIFRDFLYGMV